MRKLTGVEVRELRKAHRCPDCHSKVTVNRRTRVMNTAHDESCPMYARLVRTGQTSSVLLVRPDDMTPAEFTRKVTTAAAELAAETGVKLKLREGAYEDVGW